MPSQKDSCDAFLLSVPFFFLPGIMTFQGALEVPLASVFDLNASCLLTLLKESRLKCDSLN